MLVSTQDYLTHNYPHFCNLPNIIQSSLSSILKKIVHENEINTFLQEHKHKDAFGFAEAALDYLNVDITIHKNQLEYIPSYGRVVIIANHPLGTLDALALLHIIKDIRKDIKIIATSLLASVENINELVIPVDNIQGKINKYSLQQIYEALAKEKVIIIFPSGEVSRVRVNGIKDTKWQRGFLKIASKMQAPILPIYINAKNSRMFYTLSSINKSLATLALPHEIFKFYGKNIEFKIGQSIPFENYNLPSIPIKNRIKLFKKHLYHVAHNKSKIFKTHNAIALAENYQELKHALSSAKELGITKDGKKILLYTCKQETIVLKEIGRLREISFRQIKEGSGKKRDIDKYDLFYEHIILWDENDLQIVGSYRILKTEYITNNLDVTKLYTSTLFNYKESFKPYLANGLELGRSFIQPKYWNSRALDYLWQGIGAYLKANEDIKYMFGPVSISKTYNYYATALLIYFYQHYFNCHALHVIHKKKFIISSKLKDEFNNLFELDDYQADIVTLKNILQLQGLAIPTLYKQYSDLCEDGGVEFIDFGIDKDFDNCVDGFILIQIDKLKAKKRARYINKPLA